MRTDLSCSLWNPYLLGECLAYRFLIHICCMIKYPSLKSGSEEQTGGSAGNHRALSFRCLNHISKIADAGKIFVRPKCPPEMPSVVWLYYLQFPWNSTLSDEFFSVKHQPLF